MTEEYAGSRTASAMSWRAASLAMAFMLLLVLWGYQETTLYLFSLWTRWSDSSYGHGFLLLVLSGYLVYEQRKILAGIAPRPAFGALLAVLAGSMIWLAATLASVQVVQSVAILLLAIAVVWVISGSRVMRFLLLPILFIGFAIPVWAPLGPVLQQITVAGAYSIIRALEVPALREGFVVVLPAGQLMVEEACSGLNYLLAALTLGMFYAARNYQRKRDRLLVVLIAAGAAVLANLLRVIAIIYLAYKTDMRHPFVNDHLALGWYLFGACVLLLLLAEHFLVRRDVQLTGATTLASHGVSCAAAGNVQPRHLVLLLAACVATLSGPAINWWLSGQPVESVAIDPVLPPGTGGWAGPYASRDGWGAVYHGAVTRQAVYRKDGEVVLLYSAVYGNQSQGSELVSDLNGIAGDGSLLLQQSPERVIISPDGRKVREFEMVTLEGKQPLVWYWYRVAGRNTHSDYMAKILQVLGAVSGRTEAAVIAVSADMRGNPAGARRQLEDFSKQMSVSLEQITDGQTLQREISGR